MRKFILALAAALTVFMTAQTQVFAENGDEISPQRPRFSDGNAANSRADLAVSAYILQGTTVPQVVSTDPGYWWGYWVSTGNQQIDYFRAIDSDTAGLWSLASNNAFALSPNIFAVSESSSTMNNTGRELWQVPIWFNSGLTVYKSTSTTTGSPHKVIFYWQTNNAHIGR